LQRVVVGSYVIDNVLSVPAVHQQLVHDQQEQDEELEVVGDIDTLQHRQIDRQTGLLGRVQATATGNGAHKVNTWSSVSFVRHVGQTPLIRDTLCEL
jgi:hypothetical protein